MHTVRLPPVLASYWMEVHLTVPVAGRDAQGDLLSAAARTEEGQWTGGISPYRAFRSTARRYRRRTMRVLFITMTDASAESTFIF